MITADAEISGGSLARRERIVATGLTLASIALLFFECREVRAQADDAYISYRYAANLTEGMGLVYNAGEYVEGYTNLLWTLLVSGGLALGLDGERVGHFLGVAAGALLLGTTAAYAWSALPVGRRALSGLAAWVVLAHPALVRWSESGMESVLFAAAATAALALEMRGRRIGALAACMIATLTRPEGALLAAIVLIPPCLRESRAGVRPVATVVVYALLLVALTAWRLLYYGSPLPNTFYAKITTDPSYARGLGSVLAFLGQGLFLLLPAAALALRSDRRSWPGAAWALASLAYLVWIGGDTIGPTRFLIQVLPMIAALALIGAVGSQVRGIRWVAAGAAVAGVLWQILPGPAPRDGDEWQSSRSRTLESVRKVRHRLRALNEAKVRRLAETTPPVELVAVSGIGYLGYASRLPLIDLLGLTDATIARTPLREAPGATAVPGHRRSNPDYVLSRRPDFILIGRRGQPPLLQAHRDLLAHPDFDRLYCWHARVGGYARCDRMHRPRQHR